MGKIVALIPARAGSKGVPNKNIKLLGGYPLLAWTIETCRMSKLIDRIIISTDSTEYAELAKKYGAEAPFLRPPEISTDYSTDYEFVVHALDWLASQDEEPEYIVHMRPTTPLRVFDLVDNAIQQFIDDNNATAMRSVHEMSESAYKTFEILTNRNLKRVGENSTELDAVNNARQLFPKTYMANGYVDVLSVSYIRDNNMLHGSNVVAYVTPPVIEVDTDHDFELLECQVKSHQEFVNNNFRF